MFKQISGAIGAIAISLSLIGCGQSDTASNVETADGSTPSAADALYVVSEEPEGALPVGDARKSIKDKEEIVLEGRIGGSTKPFVDGIAAFTIVDTKVPYCSEDEGCPTPWDYCCEQNAVKDNIATVKLVDADGKPVMKDARQLLGIKELNTVIVKGIATRDDEGNLSVQADEVFVKE
jgi:hypothetical protein